MKPPSDAELQVIQTELLLNLIALVKCQQLNIELLWDAVGAGKVLTPPVAEMRESSCRLTDIVEQMRNRTSGEESLVN